ncbi:MAG TPA: YafY family protein [Thermoanaerobaculia bacterium]|nr:YafY family protein [Thermoanaerobaculia bacterium]
MRADRLLSILLLLQTHGRMTGRQLAKRLEVSERTIHRDMEALGTAGIPVVAERGVGGGWELIEGFRTSLTALSEAEVNALFVTKPSRLLADLHLDKASDAALVKMLSILPEVHRHNAELARQRIHIDVTGWKHSSEPVTILPVLQDAVWRDRRLRMTYDRGDDTASERTVDPLGLVAKGSVWYLVAAIEGDVRSYRVSRIRSADVLEQPFVRPRDFDLAAFWESSAARFRERLPRFEVVIRAESAVIPLLRSMIRFGAIDVLEPDEKSGWTCLSMHFDTEDAARHTLLGFGTSVEVIDPESLRGGIVETARSIVELNER